MWEVKAQYENCHYMYGKYYLTFTTDSIDGKPTDLGNSYYNLKLTKYSPQKSEKANAYYWKLCSMLSNELSKETYTSLARVHNQNLRAMWHELLMYVDGSPKMEIIPNTDQAELSVIEDIDYHMMPVPASVMANPTFTNSKGKEFRYYFVLRGVRTMTNKEISRLIDICIQECQELGIETKTPNELLKLDGYERN